MASKEEKPNLLNLPPEITLHIGTDKNTGNHITGQERWVLVTVQGNRRSKSLDDGEQFTFAMSPVVADPGLGLSSIAKVIDYIEEQSQILGDTIVSMILYNEGQKLSDLRKALPETFSTPEIRIEISEEIKFQTVEDLKKKLKDESIDFNDVDGVRADSDLGWWLLRASNTQSCLVARCEANSEEDLSSLKKILKENLNSLGVKVDL